MSALRSFIITLLYLLAPAFTMPLDDDDDDQDDDECTTIISSPAVHVPDGPSPAILAPYQRIPTPYPSPFQHTHATIPAPHRTNTPAILGTIAGVVIALVACIWTARYIARRRRTSVDPFKDPHKPRFFHRSVASKKRLSDESWVSPLLPPTSQFLQDLEFHRYASPQRKLVPITTPVCTPTDAEFGSRPEHHRRSVVPVPPVRVPSPVYIPPFCPSPSLSSSSSSLSPTPSSEPLPSPSPLPARLSRLLSSTFRDPRTVIPPTRPSTAHLIQTARSYAYAYRPSSPITTPLYAPPTPSPRRTGTRSRSGFYHTPADNLRTAWGSVRDTFSTVTTLDTESDSAVPHLRRAVVDDKLSTSPFADPILLNQRAVLAGTFTFPQPTGTGLEGQAQARAQSPVGTSLGLKLRLSDASEHARYRLRERERERERQRARERDRDRERAEQRLSTISQTSASTATSVGEVRINHRHSVSLEVEQAPGNEFKLRDSESVLREIGW